MTKSKKIVSENSEIVRLKFCVFRTFLYLYSVEREGDNPQKTHFFNPYFWLFSLKNRVVL